LLREGKNPRKVEGKGRFSLAKKFRKGFSLECVWVRNPDSGCINLFPLHVWKRIVQQTPGFSDSWNPHQEEFKGDRITIPEEFRKELGSTVILRPVKDHFEVIPFKGDGKEVTKERKEPAIAVVVSLSERYGLAFVCNDGKVVSSHFETLTRGEEDKIIRARWPKDWPIPQLPSARRRILLGQ